MRWPHCGDRQQSLSHLEALSQVVLAGKVVQQHRVEGVEGGGHHLRQGVGAVNRLESAVGHWHMHRPVAEPAAACR